jgi:hypothetical protein
MELGWIINIQGEYYVIMTDGMGWMSTIIPNCPLSKWKNSRNLGNSNYICDKGGPNQINIWEGTPVTWVG